MISSRQFSSVTDKQTRIILARTWSSFLFESILGLEFNQLVYKNVAHFSTRNHGALT